MPKKYITRKPSLFEPFMLAVIGGAIFGYSEPTLSSTFTGAAIFGGLGLFPEAASLLERKVRGPLDQDSDQRKPPKP